MATNFNYCPYCGSPLQKNNKPTIDDLVAHRVEVGGHGRFYSQRWHERSSFW